MDITTCHARTRDEGYYFDGIEAHYADDTERQWAVGAIFNAIVERTNALLPGGLHWYPSTSEVLGPDTYDGPDAAEAFEDAWGEARAEVLDEVNVTEDEWSTPSASDEAERPCTCLPSVTCDQCERAALRDAIGFDRGDCPDCGTPANEHWNSCAYYIARGTR